MKSTDSLKSTQKSSPSFFKIMLQDFKNVLFIPPKFACNIGRLVKQTVHLHDSNGNSWNVKISVKTGRLAFQDGWCDFVRDHSITEGEFVVFRYRGHSEFTVKIWGTDACEKTCFKETIKKSNIEAKRKASLFDCENIHLSKKQRTYEASENKCKIEMFGSMKKARNEKNFSCDMFGKTKYSRKPVICEEKKMPKISKKSKKHLNRFSKNVEEDLIQLNEVVRKFLVTEDGVCHIFDENLMNEIAPSMSTRKENSASGKGKEKPQGQGPHRNKKEATEKVPPFLKGKSIQVETESMNVKDLAPLPSPDFGFSLSLTEQSAWVELPVKLPSQFGKAKLARKMILIRDPYTRIWPVLYAEEIRFVGFIGGWEQFRRANRLKMGDCCKFEIDSASEHTLLRAQISSA